MNPLRRSMRAISGSVRDVTSVKRMTVKMVYVGTKLTIITGVATTTSIIFQILLIVRVAQYLYVYDMLINASCLMLMTQYYPDDIFYERLCKLCLLLCPVEYRSAASTGSKRRSANNNIQSKDTMAVPGYAAQVAVSMPSASVELELESNEPEQEQEQTQTQLE
eukprot:UN07704